MECVFKKYKNIFGEAGKGIHSIRFVGTAIVDYILTIVFAIITTFITKIPLELTTVGWFIMGLVLHILFGVQTSTMKYLNIKCVKK
jgi:hypothetical protein